MQDTTSAALTKRRHFMLRSASTFSRRKQPRSRPLPASGLSTTEVRFSLIAAVCIRMLMILKACRLVGLGRLYTPTSMHDSWR